MSFIDWHLNCDLSVGLGVAAPRVTQLDERAGATDLA